MNVSPVVPPNPTPTPSLFAGDERMEALVRDITNLLGGSFEPLAKAKKTRLRNKLRNLIVDIQPYFIGLAGLFGHLEFTDALSQLTLGSHRAILKHFKVPMAKQENPLLAQIRHFERMMKLTPAFQKLDEYRRVLDGCECVLQAAMNADGRKGAAHRLIQDYTRTEGEAHFQYLRSLAAREKTRRRRKPKRLTPRVLQQLVDEYRDSAAAFENRLRLIFGMERISKGKILLFDALQTRTLANIVREVSAPENPLLKFLEGLVDPCVRNALAHGRYSPNYKTGEITFKDGVGPRARQVTWSLSEFFDRTRNLSFAVLAVCGFEAVHFIEWLRRLNVELLQLSVRRIHDVYLSVRDLSVSSAFYREVVGPVTDDTDKGGGRLAIVQACGQRVTLSQQPERVPPMGNGSPVRIQFVSNRLDYIEEGLRTGRIPKLAVIESQLPSGILLKDPDGYEVQLTAHPPMVSPKVKPN